MFRQLFIIVLSSCCLLQVLEGCGNPCQRHWTPYGNHCYRFFNTRVTWNQAKQYCDAFAEGLGHLVTIHSAAEEGKVKQIIKQQTSTDMHVFIGFTDKAQEGVFKWEDGEPVRYTNWGQGDPNNGGGDEDCATMGTWQSGVWHDVNCHSFKTTYVCKIPQFIN